MALTASRAKPQLPPSQQYESLSRVRFHVYNTSGIVGTLADFDFCNH
jgi:hypothetical protein